MNAIRSRRPAIVAVLIVVLLWPMPYLASPEWEIVVADKEGKPLNGANVRLVYINYSVESNSHEMTLQTDANGRVLFPAIHRRATLMRRGFYTASAASAGVHASFGRHAYVFAFGDYQGDVVKNGYVFDWQGSPDSVQSKIVAK